MISSTNISILKSFGLGLIRDGRVELAQHESRWSDAFTVESNRISNALQSSSIQLFHIGSTSIPGIEAKPILDILLATPSLALLDSYEKNFESLGYTCKGEFGLEGRRYYVLRNEDTNEVFVHLHAWENDRPEIAIHLIFRDYLRKHPEQAKLYEAAKLVAKREKATWEKYMDLKAPVIDEILARARVWSAQSGILNQYSFLASDSNTESRGINIEFQELVATDLPLLRKWLKEPHVAEFWQEPEEEAEFRDKYLNKLSERGVRPYLITHNREPIGYIQEYEAHLVGGGWWPDAKPGIFGIDQYIGDPKSINKGLGTQIIRQFTGGLFSDPRVKKIITDPDPKNLRAIRAYEKVGFNKIGNIRTPAGDAMLLEMTRDDYRHGGQK